MLIFIITSFVHLLLITFLLLGVNYDKEYQIKITKKDIPYFVICEIISLYLLYFYKQNLCLNVFLSVGLAFLIICAYTDKKTMFVYMFPTYILFFLGIILECITMKRFSCMIVIVFMLPIILGVFNAFGRGDISMCMVIGGINYLLTFHIAESLLIECFMILLAEVFFIIKAIIEKNLKNPFCLKEKRPLGPSILISTFIILIGNIL